MGTVLLAIGAEGPAEALTHVELDGFSLDLPLGWEVRQTEIGPTTGAASVLPGAQGEGEVRLQAVEPGSGAAVSVVEVPGSLRADLRTKDAVAVAAPETFRRLWGVDLRVDWATLADVGGRRAIQLQGRFDLDGVRRAVLVTLVPADDVHHVVTLVAPPGADTMPAAATSLLRSFRSHGPEPGLGLGLPVRGVLGALVGAAVGLALALGLRRRRRAHAAA